MSGEPGRGARGRMMHAHRRPHIAGGLHSDEVVEYFADDDTYYDMRAQPESGHENLRKIIGAFLAIWDRTGYEFVSLLAPSLWACTCRLRRRLSAVALLPVLPWDPLLCVGAERQDQNRPADIVDLFAEPDTRSTILVLESRGRAE